MANSEDVLERARNHTRTFTQFDRACQEYHLAEARLIVTLAAEVRELRRDRARLDWLMDHLNPWLNSREAIDTAMGGGEGEA